MNVILPGVPVGLPRRPGEGPSVSVRARCSVCGGVITIAPSAGASDDFGPSAHACRSGGAPSPPRRRQHRSPPPLQRAWRRADRRPRPRAARRRSATPSQLTPAPPPAAPIRDAAPSAAARSAGGAALTGSRLRRRSPRPRSAVRRALATAPHRRASGRAVRPPPFAGTGNAGGRAAPGSGHPAAPRPDAPGAPFAPFAPRPRGGRFRRAAPGTSAVRWRRRRVRSRRPPRRRRFRRSPRRRRRPRAARHAPPVPAPAAPPMPTPASARRWHRRRRRYARARTPAAAGTATPARPPINPFLANDPNAKAKRLGARAGLGHRRVLPAEARRGAARRHAEAALPRGDQEELRGVRRAGRPRVRRRNDALPGCPERRARRGKKLF